MPPIECLVLVPWYYFRTALFAPTAFKLVSVVRARKPREKIKRRRSFTAPAAPPRRRTRAPPTRPRRWRVAQPLAHVAGGRDAEPHGAASRPGRDRPAPFGALESESRFRFAGILGDALLSPARHRQRLRQPPGRCDCGIDFARNVRPRNDVCSCTPTSSFVALMSQELGPKTKSARVRLHVSYWGDCVAKLLLRRWANRDSVGMRRRIAGAVDDGAPRGCAGAILLHF
jgi:hypothetical protein